MKNIFFFISLVILVCFYCNLINQNKRKNIEHFKKKNKNEFKKFLKNCKKKIQLLVNPKKSPGTALYSAIFFLVYAYAYSGFLFGPGAPLIIYPIITSGILAASVTLIALNEKNKKKLKKFKKKKKKLLKKLEKAEITLQNNNDDESRAEYDKILKELEKTKRKLKKAQDVKRSFKMINLIKDGKKIKPSDVKFLPKETGSDLEGHHPIFDIHHHVVKPFDKESVASITTTSETDSTSYTTTFPPIYEEPLPYLTTTFEPSSTTTTLLPNTSQGGSSHAGVDESHFDQSDDSRKDGNGTYKKVDIEGNELGQTMVIDSPYMKIFDSGNGFEMMHSHKVSLPNFIEILSDGYHLFKYNGSIAGTSTTSQPQGESWSVYKMKQFSTDYNSISSYSDQIDHMWVKEPTGGTDTSSSSTSEVSEINTYGYPSIPDPTDSTAYISMIADDELVIYLDRSGEINPTEVHEKGEYIGRVNKPYKIYRFKILNMDVKAKLYFFNRSKGITPQCYFSGHIHYRGKTYPTNNKNYKIVGIETLS